MKLDKWQEEILVCEGNICLVSGRQVGKSTIIAIKAARFALKYKNKEIIIGAAVERQELLIFRKILDYIPKSNIKGRASQGFVELTNGSIIRCVPIGDTGLGVRGFTSDMTIIDEAHFVTEIAWEAILPMTFTTGGPEILLSSPSPVGKEGHFYECFSDDSFSKFYKSSEEILELDTRTKEQKEYMRKKLENHKKSLTKIQYAREYLGQFLDEMLAYFPNKLLNEVCIQ